MTQFAVITIELPLGQGGVQEDAEALAKALTESGLATEVDEIDDGTGRPFGAVVSVRLENRRDGAMGRARAQALLDGFGG